MTPGATLPPADEQRQPPLGDEELAEMDALHVEFTQPRGARQCRHCGGSWPCPVSRLIADLRASRARIKELEEERDEWRDAHQSEFR